QLMQIASYFTPSPHPPPIAPMSLRSLRSKIFLLVVALLLAVAAFVMLTSQRNVTRTVMNSERHAVSNVMELVLRDAEARWGALLADKISTVR
ncbi:hypothetical protein MMA71_23160, partial [Salmonella enterica]|nr:hypothetical protein [Salmonella enterica]